MKKVISKVMMVIMALLMTVLLCSALWQVFSRFVLNNPSTITEELSRYTLIWSVMIGAGYAFSDDSHIALTLVKDKLHGKAALILNIFIELVIWFFVIAVLFVGGFTLCRNNFAQLTPVLRLNKGLVYSCVPLLGVIISIVKIDSYVTAIVGYFKNKKEGAK